MAENAILNSKLLILIQKPGVEWHANKGIYRTLKSIKSDVKRLDDVLRGVK
jgi:hypothetical protein